MLTLRQFSDSTLTPKLRSFVLRALIRNDWNIRATARELGRNRTDFYKLLHRLKLVRPGGFRGSPSPGSWVGHVKGYRANGGKKLSRFLGCDVV